VTVVDDEVVPAVDDAEGASAVLTRTATLNGQVTAGWPWPSVSVFWGGTDGGTDKAAWSNEVVVGVTNGAFAVSLTGLAPDATYYYRCYASNAVGASWAPLESDFATAAFEYWIGSASWGTGGMTLFWQGQLGWTYELRFSSNLTASGVWATVMGCSNLPGSSGTMSCTDTNCAGCLLRYYRLSAQ
jgi:hypothetical protein